VYRKNGGRDAIAATKNFSISSGTQAIRDMGFFTGLDFEYKDRYILGGLMRRDGSSLFGAGNRWQTFGRGSAANGIEISAAEGADAVAVHDGTVAFAGTFSGFGNLVILDHGSQTFSLYGDLLEIGVKKGARVEHGQPVGTAGPIPSGSDGIYFELRVDGHPVDPLQWLKKR